jgi:RNA polymerase sigma-70 factor, ECF subfamily
MSGGESEAGTTAEAVARRSYGKLVAFLVAQTRSLAAAEDALADAFAAALADWPRTGIPDKPEAWLLTVARRKAIDAARRRRHGDEAAEQLRLLAAETIEAAAEAGVLPDHRLALMFACAHPAIEQGIRAPLILQTILGLDAASIASAFLVAPAAMSQRLVRAKHKIARAGIPFCVPERDELTERLAAVLDAIYAGFAEGWSDPAGTDARRRNLAEEGIWLGRLALSLLPEEPEALGLLALMLHAEARRGARRSATGDYVPLGEQDPARWNAALIDEAEVLLHRAGAMNAIGRYQLEAAIQSAHIIRRRTGQADWAAIERLYEALYALTSSPVVAINRAVAQAETKGAAAGLAALDALAGDKRLADYQPYWAARAGLLERSGAVAAADEAYQRAIGLEADPALRRFLQQRQAALRPGSGRSNAKSSA